MGVVIDQGPLGEMPVPTASKARNRWLHRLWDLAIPSITIVIVAGLWFASVLDTRPATLGIVAWATRDGTGWHVAGRVITLKDAIPVRARVWGVAVDSVGSTFSPPACTTDSAGEFRFAPIPPVLSADTTHEATDIVIYASSPDSAETALGRVSPGVRLGKKILRLSGSGRVFELHTSPYVFAAVGSAFFLTMLIALVQIPPGAIRRKHAKYYTLVVLSFLFTASMILLIAIGIEIVNAQASPGDVMSLGFASVYRASYVKDQPPEWILTMTTPHAVNGAQVATGFGAPLWLLLIAVLGSATFTIALLVKHTKRPVNFQDEDDFRSRIEELVRHQFYILFSPLGGILVYQILVAAGAGSVPASVALVMFAAGSAVNILLDKALNAVQEALK